MQAQQMNKDFVCYFMASALFNALLSLAMPSLDDTMTETFGYLLEGRRLPALTEWALAFPWWPHLFGILFLSGGMLGIFTKIRERVLCHTLILCLMAELIIAVHMLLAYVLPFVSTTCTLGCG